MTESDGLCDLQVNGFAGVDFNDATITPRAMDVALEAMRAGGVTICLPTLITATEPELRTRLVALDAAVARSRLGPLMVPGYHIEGPFLNPGEGYRGCHPAAAMTEPDAALYARLGTELSRPILLVTLAPELPGATAAIAQLCRAGVAVAMAHSAADFAAVRTAADAGATLSTHLGNSLPQLLHKTQNPLLAQLAEPRLTACFIADGHHLVPAALAALIAIKGTARSILVTDATAAAAAAPGRHRFAGMEIERSAEGVVRVPGQSNLAGSALTLDEAVRNLVAWGIASPSEALRMASGNARRAIAAAAAAHGISLSPPHVRWSDGLEVVAIVD